jgi:thiol-disulfide isomerase/thioredoxin
MFTKTATLLALLLVGACDKASSNDQGAAPNGGHAHTACKGDKCLPDVSFHDTDGRAYTLKDLTGKVVVVNFWATWCHPCQKEIPDLSKLSDKYKHDLVVLGVMADDPSNNDLLNFQSDYAMTYPVIRLSSDIDTAFNHPQAFPTTFLFDRTGHRVGSPHLGAIRLNDLDKQLAELVAQK